MTKNRPKYRMEDFFSAPAIATHVFRAGDVARYVGMEKWRLAKFLSGKRYQISPSGQIGQGKGSWRLFSQEDLYRLGAANRMVEDGFTAKFISSILQQVDDQDLLTFDKDGEITASDVKVYRTNKGPRIGSESGLGEQQPYYVLPFRQLIADIDKRIFQEKRRR